MTSKSPRIYIYKITFEEVPYYYYGVKKEKYYNQKYFGSPVTHKWCWEFYTPKKQILQFFEFSDEGWLQAKEVETKLIKPFYNSDKWCLNEACGGIISLSILRETGKKAYKNGLAKISTEERREIGRKGGKNAYKNGLAKISIEERREIGRKNGKKTKELGIGIHGLTTEQRRENGRKNGKKHYENKTACFSISPEKRKEAKRKSEETQKKNKTGIYSITMEQRVENSKKSVQKMNSQKWMCLETGYITTSGPLTAYQRKRGIDTSKRIRIL